ncbi:MAG: 2-phospho-L-lactate guanylyltransferase [Acidimicrobiales bacterium]|nr:2-phospho-L-lactate guanylyltransferase [Acidimicrobiales bacterium]
MGPTAVLIPVKAFGQAKRRLAAVLDDDERADLARSMATIVVRAAGSLPVVVVCDDAAVRAWADEQRVEVLWAAGLGLNGAVLAGIDHLAQHGIAQAIVAHADLPLATDLAWVARAEGVTLVPDRHGDGTNVASVPTGAGFTFAYGAGSFLRHQDEARRLGLPLRTVTDVRLGWDVDRPEDLDVPLPGAVTCR